MALSPKLQREVLAVFYGCFAEVMIEQGFLEYQALADLLKDPERVTQAIQSCIIAARSPENPYLKTPFGLTSRS